MTFRKLRWVPMIGLSQGKRIVARSRNIKPGFFTNDELAACSPLARILFVGLWTVADRAGRMLDRPRKLKAELLPFDDVDCDELLSELASAGFIDRYEADGLNVIQVNNFDKHQHPHPSEKESELPSREISRQSREKKRRVRERSLPSREKVLLSQADSLLLIPDSLTPDSSDQREPEPSAVGSEANDLLRLLGNPDDAKFVWQVGWLVAAGDMTKAVAVDAAAGPRAVGGVGNPVGYFRRSLENAVGDEALASLLSKVPQFDPVESQPLPFAFELASALALTEEP